MIPVAKVAEPPGYASIKAGGDAWLQANPAAKHPKDLWSPFLPELAGPPHSAASFFFSAAIAASVTSKRHTLASAAIAGFTSARASFRLPARASA